MEDEREIRARWREAGQEQVFRFWDALDAAGRRGLLEQLARIDPGAVAGVAETAGGPRLDPTGLEPVEALAPDDPELPALAERGTAELAAGRVAVVTVAGGQGTRLGFDGPKGAFPIGPVTGRSLFEIFAQRLARLAARHGRPVPWILMTSPAGDAPTRRFFHERGHFGLDPSSVRFVVQGTLPLLDAEGRILLAEPGRVAEAPDGHGGLFAALLASGALAELADRGVERLFYHHVDNPLVRTADPVYLGLHVARGAEMSCKAVAKREPLEPMGFLCRRGGRTCVVEYSEIPPEVAAARGPEGGLRFRLGSVGIHVLERPFVEAVGRGPALPLHVARKPARVLGPDGRPETLEARKLERFVFDGLARARVVAVMEPRREDEYSPGKSARGEASPESARRDLAASYRRWIEEARLEPPGADVGVEMDHAHFDGPEDLARSGLRRISDAAPRIRIARGAKR